MQANDKRKVLLQQLTQVFTTIPFNQTLGLTIKEIHPLEPPITMTFSMHPTLIGNFMQGILHGGVISSVLDMAGGMAIMTDLIARQDENTHKGLADIIGHCSTIDLHINYLRPGKGESFKANAYLVKSGQKISFARMELFNQDDLLIATGTGAYNVI